MPRKKKPEITIPIVGCVIVGVVSILGIIISLITLLGNPNYDTALLQKYLPVLKQAASLGASLTFLFSTILLIGVILSILKHPKGKLTVRVASYVWLVLGILFQLIFYLNTTSWYGWTSLQDNSKTGFSIGLFAVLILSIIWTLFVVYLFKESENFFTRKAIMVWGVLMFA